MDNDIEEVLLSEAAIRERLDTLAAQITADYVGQPPPVVVALLNGSFIFAADLLRRIPLALEFASLRVSSYEGSHSSGIVRFYPEALPPLAGRRVLLLDDILDTGATLRAVSERLAACGPEDLRTVVFLRKERPRIVEADYVAFDIPDRFVVGYGLDYRGRYRNLPYLGVLREACAQ